MSLAARWWHRHGWLLLLAVVVLLLSSGAWSAEEEKGVGEITMDFITDKVNELEEQFKSITDAWFGPLEVVATNLLIALGTLALIWQALQIVLRGGDFGDFATLVVRWLLVVGFYLVVLQNAQDWSAAMVESFARAGQIATTDEYTGEDLSAANVLMKGFDFAQRIMGVDLDFWGQGLAKILLGMCAVLLYALMAVYLLMVLAEMYLVTAAGILFLGFGATDWTSDIAKRYLMYIISVGAKLYAMFLVMGMSDQALREWMADATLSGNWTILIMILGVMLVQLYLVLNIPAVVQGLVNGTSVGNESAIVGSMANVGTAAVVGTGALVASKAMVEPAAAAPGAVGQAWQQAKSRGIGGIIAAPVTMPAEAAINLMTAMGASWISGGAVSPRQALQERALASMQPDLSGAAGAAVAPGAGGGAAPGDVAAPGGGAAAPGGATAAGGAAMPGGEAAAIAAADPASAAPGGAAETVGPRSTGQETPTDTPPQGDKV